MNRLRFWILLFTLLFIASLDYWQWSDEITLKAGGLPGWLYYFILLQAILVVVLYMFSKYFWGKKD
ncbi:hypothetical protein JYU23_00015 [bacterium AH-315-C07]|nr:hypothetical protein [bacterium AH-315-C07]